MKNIIKYFGILLIFTGIFVLTGCDNERKDTTTTQTGVTEINYSGTYNSANYDQMTITKNNGNYKASISLYRLTTLEECNVDSIENDVLNISCTDDSAKDMKFKFDYKTGVLTVTESNWSLINVDDTFEFSK